MTPEQFVAIMGAVTALVVALTAAAMQLKQFNRQLNGRISELLEHVAASSHKEGELRGRDFMRRLLSPPPDDEGESIGQGSDPGGPASVADRQHAPPLHRPVTAEKAEHSPD